MSDALKTPTSRGLTLYINQMIRKFLDRLAKGRPATLAAVNGSIVTVNFEIMGVTLPQVTMPLAGPEYIRYPTQVGDKGVCLPADFYIGAMSGLGAGTADNTPRGNLSTLIFFPIGNKNWSAPDDTQAVVIYGPNGVILRDSGSKTVVTLTPDGVDIDAQHNVTVEADTKVEATVGSNSVLLNTTEILATVGSNSILVNATEIVLTIGAATFTMTAAGIISTVPITAPTVTGSTGIVAGTSLTVGGVQMSGHHHSVTVPSTPATVNSGPPL